MNSGWVAFDDVQLLGPDPTNVTTRQYYYAGGARVALRENNTLYWLLTDHLGSTAITANADGTKKAELRYKAWGEYRDSGYAPSDTPTTYRFTGQRDDAYIKLVQMGVRWYDPELGRWTNPDTIIPDPANPQSLNRYSYVYNNALKYTDPSGHCIFGLDTLICIAVGGGALVGAAVSYGSQVIENRNSGMSWGDALTTDLDAGKIAGDAAGGAFIGGAFYIAGPVAELGFLKTAAVGGVASVGAGQTSAAVEAVVDEVVTHLQSGGNFDAARVWGNALQLGLLDPERVVIDGASGAVAAGIAYPVAKKVSSMLKAAGLIESSSENPVMTLMYKPALDGSFELIAEQGRTIVLGPEEVNVILLTIARRLPEGVFRQIWGRIGEEITDYVDDYANQP
jgi:RHS repeat-associated protein